MDRSIIEEIISRRLCDFETAIPAKVTDVAKDKSLTVEILIKKVTVDGIVDVDNIAIEGIKPFVIGNENATINIEIVKGSQVLLVGLSRHAREWLGSKSDDAVIPRSAYGNTFNDLVAVPLFRGDRENGKSSNIVLGAEGDITIESKYGQTLKFNSDGSIDLNPKSGSKVTINGSLDVSEDICAGGDVEDLVGKLSSLRNEYKEHVHSVTVTSFGEPTISTGPSAPPSL